MPLQKTYKKARLVFTVTNDLNYDQRMIRICTSLQKAGFSVLLIGRRQVSSLPLTSRPFDQKRLYCYFEKGKLFYIEYNIRLFIFLLFKKLDLVCAIDLDTILPCYFISLLRQKKRVYDAHELFCEMKEIVSRPKVYAFWKFIEKHTVPKFKFGYTVNQPIQQVFESTYGVNYKVIMNVPFAFATNEPVETEKFIIYQGAVNEGRSFETLIPAFRWINCPFYIYGEGNLYAECRKIIEQHGLQNKVILKGKVLPDDLKKITQKALLGVTLFENYGLNNYYSLGNRFFDYIHANIPQICVSYPAYSEINKEFQVAVLVEDLSPQSIAAAINSLLNDKALQKKLRSNCIAAKEVYSWQNEEKKLTRFYQTIFEHE